MGFRKNHNALYSLLKMIEKQLDNIERVGVIFMAFLNAFTINHSLLLEKLKAYGSSDHVLSLLQSYVCNRFQRSIINDYFCSWNEVIPGAPQSSILGSLLCNIFLNDIVLLISKCQLRNYVVNNPFYKSKKICRKLKTIWKWISWFYTSGFMKVTRY